MSDELLTTDALTLVVDSDAGGTEPADGGWIRYRGGTGDVAIKYEDTSNENQLQFTGAAGGYSFSSKISVGGTGNAEFVDQGSGMYRSGFWKYSIVYYRWECVCEGYRSYVKEGGGHRCGSKTWWGHVRLWV